MELIECIHSIKDHIDNILNNYLSNKELINKYLDKDINEIVFIASGTSYNASKVTRYFAYNECQIKTSFFYPNDFLHYSTYINEDALYILVSQGGSTKMVFDSLELIKSKGLKHLTITEKLDSPIALSSDLAIEMGSDDEPFLYRTLGYSTTVATVWLIETIISLKQGLINKEKESDILNNIKKAISNIEPIISKTEKWYQANRFSLLKRNKIILAGACDFYETSNEADIKLMEMIPMYSRSFELEELIHGPQNAFDDDTIFFLLTNKKYGEEKVIKTAEFLKKEIGYCAMVGDVTYDERDLKINFLSDGLEVLEEITAFQVIAYYMATDRGRDLKRGINTSLKNYINKSL